MNKSGRKKKDIVKDTGLSIRMTEEEKMEIRELLKETKGKNVAEKIIKGLRILKVIQEDLNKWK